MSRRTLLLAAAPVALSALALLAWPSAPRRAGAPSAPSATVPGAASPASPARSRRQAVRARYQLSSEHHAVIDGKERGTVRIEGTWTTTERAEGRVEARLAASRITMGETPPRAIAAAGDEAPSAASVAAPFELSTIDGVLRSIAFPEGMSRAGRALLTGLATTFQHTDRPGASWSVEEEDLMGTYVAEYERLSSDRVARKRARYTRLRGASGLTTEDAGGLAAEESTELRFDDKGLVSATVRIVHTVPLTRGKAPVRMITAAKLTREDVEELPFSAGLALEPAPISDYIDRAAGARKRDEAMVAGATTPELVAETRRVAHLDRKQPDTGKVRALTQNRLVSLVRLDDRAAGAIADAVRQDPRDRETVSLLTGALAGADAPSAADSLASLLGDDALTPEARDQVLHGLTLSRSPTAESAAALSRALDKPYGDQAALALGAQARGLGDDGAGGDAVDQLLQRYAEATTPADKRTYLLALGNTGSTKVLDALVAAIQGPDFELARIATRGLRLIPGDDVDDMLLSLIQSGSPVVLDAIQAVAYRSPSLWQPRLQAAKAELQGQKRIVDAIEAVLVRWANLSRPGKL